MAVRGILRRTDRDVGVVSLPAAHQPREWISSGNGVAAGVSREVARSKKRARRDRQADVIDTQGTVSFRHFYRFKYQLKYDLVKN